MDRYEYQPVPVEQLADYLNTSEGHEFTFHPPTLVRNAICELYAIKKGQVPAGVILPAQGSSEVNDGAWKLHDGLTDFGPLNGAQFNNLKGCFYEALKVCFAAKAVPKATAERWNGSDSYREVHIGKFGCVIYDPRGETADQLVAIINGETS